MLLHRLFTVFLCAHYDQEKEGAILELNYPDDQSKEIVLCKVFHNVHGICSCVLGRQRIISPKLSLDPRTLRGYVKIEANGWLVKADTFQQGPAAIPGIIRAARTSQSLSGPAPVYFVLQLEIPIPLPLYNSEVLTFALGSNATLFSFDGEIGVSILDVQNIVGVEIVIVNSLEMEVELRCQGKHVLTKTIYRKFSHTSVWAWDLGVFIDFQNKQIAFINVERSVLISRYHGIETSQPLIALLRISKSRARISSGRDVHISRDIKPLLLQNISKEGTVADRK